MPKMSALNMAMNGNAYKMIEIKKVSGPVVPLRKYFQSDFSRPLSLPQFPVTCKVTKYASISRPVTYFPSLNPPLVQTSTRELYKVNNFIEPLERDGKQCY